MSRATFVPQQPVKSGRSRGHTVKPKRRLSSLNTRSTRSAKGATAPSQVRTRVRFPSLAHNKVQLRAYISGVSPGRYRLACHMRATPPGPSSGPSVPDGTPAARSCCLLAAGQRFRRCGDAGSSDRPQGWPDRRFCAHDAAALGVGRRSYERRSRGSCSDRSERASVRPV